MHDEELWGAFSASTLPHEQWTHRAHLRVAWLHLRRYSVDEAHLRMRAGIIRADAFHGLVESPARGYHETMTRVWLALVAALTKEVDAQTSEAFVDACANRLGKDAVLRHYSRDRIMSLGARAIFVAPDLAALPDDESDGTARPRSA